MIWVIWVLAVLAVFTVAVNRQAGQELLFGQWMRNSIVTRTLAKAGIERGLLEIQADEFLTFDALNESWASQEKAFKNIPLGEGSFEVVCERADENVSAREEKIRYGVCDESARININTVPEQILKNLLQVAVEKIPEGKAIEISQAIVDWRDTDDAAMAQGAEAEYYHKLKDPYEPGNKPFESTEELLMVKGVTREIFDALEPYITVYTAGRVNFNTASAVPLEALGIQESLARKIIEFRQGADTQEGTKDDQVFQLVESITPALSAAASFSSEEYQQIANAISQNLVGVASAVFRIQSIGRLIKGDRAVEGSITAVLQRDGTILYWREGEL